jgi:Transcription factor Tfb2
MDYPEYLILTHLQMLGLVEIFPPDPDDKRAKFYVTSLLQQFLMSSTGQQQHGIQSS